VNSKSKENKKGRSYFVEDQKEMKEEKKLKKANVRGTK
jgi:predicted RNA-binding protein YlxR (DUF448 family)